MGLLRATRTDADRSARGPSKVCFVVAVLAMALSGCEAMGRSLIRAAAVKAYSGEALPEEQEAMFLFGMKGEIDGPGVDFSISGDFLQAKWLLLPPGQYSVSVVSDRVLYDEVRVLGGTLIGEVFRRYGSASCSMSFQVEPGVVYMLMDLTPRSVSPPGVLGGAIRTCGFGARVLTDASTLEEAALHGGKMVAECGFFPGYSTKVIGTVYFADASNEKYREVCGHFNSLSGSAVGE